MPPRLLECNRNARSRVLRVKQPPLSSPFPALCPFDGAYDEMFAFPGIRGATIRPLFRTRLELPGEELKKSYEAANLSFRHQGITPAAVWIGFDPTNYVLCGERHVRVAVGRDYSEDPPGAM